MKKIYLIRHAQSQSNAGSHAIINANIALTDLGNEQAQQLAKWLIAETDGNIDQVFISSYLRTAQTAEPLLQLTGKKAQIIQDLHEFNYLSFPSIDGLNLTERRKMADDYWLDFAPNQVEGSQDILEQAIPALEQAESFENFVKRVGRANEFFAQLPNGTYVAYSHGLWLSMYIWLTLGQPTDNNKAMQKFRQFEASIRPKNCEAYLLTFCDNQSNEQSIPTICKVRTRGDDFVNAFEN